MEFIEVESVTGLIESLGTQKEFSDLQCALIANPELGDVIQGTGGAPQNSNGRSQSWETRWSQNHLHDRLHWRVDLFSGCLYQECQGDADGGRCQEAVKAGGIDPQGVWR